MPGETKTNVIFKTFFSSFTSSVIGLVWKYGRDWLTEAHQAKNSYRTYTHQERLQPDPIWKITILHFNCRFLFYMDAPSNIFKSDSQSIVAVKLYSKFPHIVWFRVDKMCLSLLKWGRRPLKNVRQSDQRLSMNWYLPRKLLNVMGTSSKLGVKIQ